MLELIKIFFLFFLFWNISVYGQEENHCASEVINGVTFRARCRFNGTETPCDGIIRPNTVAIISCSFGYRRSLRPISEIIRCTETGEWDHHPVSCEPDCGKLNSTTQLISDEEGANTAMVPWHASIYKRNETYDYVCAGTIFSAKLIISAAHCFWNEEDQIPESIDLYRVLVGKSFRSYDAVEKRPRNVQFFNILEFHFPKSFHGVLNSYQNDIVILILSDFIKFKFNIQPICIKWLRSDEQDVQQGSKGHIAAWGGVSLPRGIGKEYSIFDERVSSRLECVIEPSLMEVYDLTTNENFCVGYPKDRGYTPITFEMCEGDGGGGYVVANNDGGSPRHYLLGVLSTPLSTKCKGDESVLYTNVQHFRKMITKYEIRYRPK